MWRTGANSAKVHFTCLYIVLFGVAGVSIVYLVIAVVEMLCCLRSLSVVVIKSNPHNRLPAYRPSNHCKVCNYATRSFLILEQ